MKPEIEYGSPTWKAITNHVTDRIETLRKRNDSLTLSPAQTDQLRGRLAELKDLLALGKPDPAGVVAEFD